MSAATILADLRARGCTVSVLGDRVRVSPASALTADLRATIAERKAELLALLAAESAPLLVPAPAARVPLWWEHYPGMTDAHYDGVLDADCRRHGSYTPARQYPEPAEDPATIWRRIGLPVLAKGD